jgi:hypothetical protein
MTRHLERTRRMRTLKSSTTALWLLATLALPLTAQRAAGQTAWVLGKGVGDSLTALWERSVDTRLEQVACLAGEVGRDTVRVTAVMPLVTTSSDSLGAEAGESLDTCGAPEWIGTIHTHVRSTDADAPATRFSPGDRAVMSEWVRRWTRPGAFCVLHSDRAMHCEVYPPAER